MDFPYSTYSELSLPIVSLYDNQLMLDTTPPPPLGSYPSLKSYAGGMGYGAPCPLPSQACHGLAGEVGTLSSVIWESRAEQESFLHGPLVEAFQQDDYAYSPEAYSPDTFSPGHHVYSSNSTYTRMFRGRKSKAASEVMDELRPYACDICQAAFARSHDRDRHKRSHTGETPYRCQGCGSGFKRPDARKRHWERDPACAQEDWLRVRHTPEGAKRRARAKAKPYKKQNEVTIKNEAPISPPKSALANILE